MSSTLIRVAVVLASFQVACAVAREANEGAASVNLPHVDFRGAHPGKSTIDDVQKAWGAPINILKQGETVKQTYRLKGTPPIEAHFESGVLRTIKILLEEEMTWDDLVAKMRLDKVEPVDVVDESGDVLGAAFPESGVLFAFAVDAKDRRVAQVIIEPLDAQAFALRGEQRMAENYGGALSDFEVATALDERFARAQWLRARLLAKLGRLDEAGEAVDAALQVDPKNHEYLLTSATILAEVGELDEAVAKVEAVLTDEALRPEFKARALSQLGEHLAAGPAKDHKRALALQIEAIKLAEPLAEDEDDAVRRKAQDTLVSAHVAAARCIAWGNWKMKMKIVPEWLKQAEELADRAAAVEKISDHGMQVCRGALSASAGMEGEIDPMPWVDQLMAITKPKLDSATDPLRRRYLEWQVGGALYDALQVYHTRGDLDQALKYGKLAIEHLETVASGEEIEPMEAYLLGRVYFRMGSVHAVHAKQPEEAVRWFERAIPLLEQPLPRGAVADASRHGETFVSMAVSYWSVGSRDEAIRLTDHGLRLMEQAVDDGVLEQSALKVPYTNLATMHRFLGDDEQAKSFTTMASRVERTQRE